MNEGQYYHVYTDGLGKSLLYRDEDDYLHGMNDIPICLLKTGAEMLCFCLMSNHVHFILKGTEAECGIFIDEFKRRSSMRLRKKYFEVSPLHGLETSVKQIDINNYLRTAIGYVLRNPLAAGINCMPDAYRWSSCSLYFRRGYSSDKNAGLSHISDFTVKEIWSILGTRVKLPGSYLFDENRMIHPSCYVNVRHVENIFQSPKQLLYYLSRNDDGKFEIEMGISDKMTYDYGQLKSFLNEICHTEFGKSGFGMLSANEKCRAAVLMKKRYGTTAKQFARLTGMEIKFLETLM